MPAIQTIYTGNKKTDEYLSNIYKILNELKETVKKSALSSDLKNTNKVLDSLGGGSGIDHSTLLNLDYASSGHIGFEPTVTKGNLTAGSTKVSIGGTGTGALIGVGASVDIVPGNIAHNDLGSKQGGVAGEYYHLTSALLSGLHERSHALDSTSDHTIGSLTSTYLVKSDGSKLVPATNTDAEVSAAVSASHAAVTVAGAPLTLSGQQITMNYDSGTLDLDGNNLRVKTGVWQPLDADLTAISALASTGFAVRSASDTWLLRSIAVSGNGISISNGDGVAANPTVSLDIGTGATQIAAGNHTHSQLHDRQHSLQSTSDHTGTGTKNYVMKADANGLPSNSIIYDNGTSIGINTIVPDANSKLAINAGALQVIGTSSWPTTGTGLTELYDGTNSIIQSSDRSGSVTYKPLILQAASHSIKIGSDVKVTVDTNGNVGISTVSPVGKLDVKTLYGGSTTAIALTLEGFSATDNIFGSIGPSTVYGATYHPGGLTIIGKSESSCSTTTPALTLEGRVYEYDPVDSRAAIHLFGSKNDGANALASAETVLRVSNLTTELLSINGNGNIVITKPAVGSSSFLNFKITGLAHGMTDVLPTDDFGAIKTNEYDTAYIDAGLSFYGISTVACSANIPGIKLTGLFAEIDPADGRAAIRLVAGKKSGTGIQVLADAETVFDVYNNTTLLSSIKGNGNFNTIGHVQVATVQRFWDLGGNNILSNNIYYSSGFKYLTSSTASAITQTSTGNITLSVYPSGTADAAATPITALLIANATGDATFANYVQAKYKSSDGTAGATGSGSTITVKDGIVTAIS